MLVLLTCFPELGSSSVRSKRLFVRNLITQKDCKLLRDFSNKYGLAYHRSDELLVTPRRVHVAAQRKHFQKIVDNVAQAILQAASAAKILPVDITTRLVIDESVLMRTAPGGQPKHADSRNLDGSLNHTPSRQLSASVGCSVQGAYEGGELNFYSRRNGEVVDSFVEERYQLQVGEAVIFTSSDENVHSVNPLRSGHRHQLLFWFVHVNDDVQSKHKRELKRMKEWLVAHKLASLFRFYKEFLSHGLLLKNHQLFDPSIHERIGLSTIESRRLSVALKKRNEL